MSILKTLLLLTFLTSCDFKKESQQQANPDIETLNKKEMDSGTNTPNNQGELIATIQFGIKANQEELKDFEDGVIPWVSIEKPEEKINRLIDADTIVIPYDEITLVVDYPLNKPATFLIKSSAKGFTRKQLVLEISKEYHEIYQTEESSAKTKTVPIEKREGLINRNQTDGKYGIWGHDIGDLDLSSIEVYKMTDGKIQILLGIES